MVAKKPEPKPAEEPEDGADAKPDTSARAHQLTMGQTKEKSNG